MRKAGHRHSVRPAPEVVQDRINGLIVSGDPASIAAAALQFRVTPSGTGDRRQGKAFAEEHGHAHRMALEYENLLLRLLAGEKRRMTPSS